MTESLRSNADGPADYVLIQFANLSVFLVIPAVAGWWWLFADERGREWRMFPIVFAFLFLVFLMSGGKGYYVAPLYLPLFAAGAIWIEEVRIVWRTVLLALIGVGAVVGLFLSLPLVSPERLAPFSEINNELGETYGWSQLTDQVEAVYVALPTDEQSTAVIFAANYGEAGAIEVIGGERLPASVTGHNNYWLWGPGNQAGPIIGVGPVESSLALICPELDLVTTITNEAKIENEEYGAEIWLCRRPTAPLSSVWDEVRHYN
jgi:hypothetical protein